MDTISIRRAIARCIREQRRCKRALPDPGAWMGLCDWLQEECILRVVARG